MEWRNEQTYHLRQSGKIVKNQQDIYFNDVIYPLFEDKYPNQILFSFLKDETCIGYGGLVHINWANRNAEISFLIETKLETNYFGFYWEIFLKLIEEVAFSELSLRKIYTWAFDLRPKLYEILENSGYSNEARLRKHNFIDGKFIDTVIHSKLSKRIRYRKAEKTDLELTFKWSSDPLLRKYSLNKETITTEVHQKWFQSKINDPSCLFLIGEIATEPVGVFRLDMISDNGGKISYLLDSKYHRQGIGAEMMSAGILHAIKETKLKFLKGEVHIENHSSLKIFRKFGFEEISCKNDYITFKLNIK
jgi:RimJ/RimL family protein N-acetyltransferase